MLRGWKLENVIVASADIEPGTQLDDQSVTIDNMPAKLIFESVLRPAEMAATVPRTSSTSSTSPQGS